VVASLRDEMKAAHCDAPMPEKILDRLALAQRARDAQMALRLVDVGATGAVLVTGNGHARVDRGVPASLARARPGRRGLRGPFEVSPGKIEPALYAAEFGKGRCRSTSSSSRRPPSGGSVRGAARHDFTKRKSAQTR
jgi:hypothetical protein